MRKFVIKLQKQYIFAGYASYKNKTPEDGFACHVDWKGRLTPKRFGIALKAIGEQILKDIEKKRGK